MKLVYPKNFIIKGAKHMKRILTLILVLVLALGMFASCDKIGQFIPGLGGECEHNYADGKCTECGESDPNYVPPHTHNFVEGKCECGEEDPDYVPTPEVDEGLQGAYDYLHQMYKSMKNTAGNYDLVKNVNVGADIFTVTWSVSVDSITITEADDKFTVNIPELGLGDPAINYELTFVVANAAGETLTRTYKLVVPKFKPLTFDEYYETEGGEPVVVEGIITGMLSKAGGDSVNGLYLQDSENKGGYYIYSLDHETAGKYEIGMKVIVKGNKDIYNGTHEVKDATVVITDSTLNPVQPVDITELYKNATNTSAKELTGMQGLLVTIKGVTVLDAGSNGYYNWTLAGKKSYVRISSSNNCTTKAEQETIIANHAANFYNLADVTGHITIYNNAMYIAPVTADAFSNFVEQEKPDSVQVEVEKGNLTVASPIVVAGDVTLPTAGTNFADVAISWALAETANASLAGNVLTPVLPLTGSVEITLTATLTKGDVTDTKNFTVVIKALEPITIPEANELAEGHSHNTYTADKYVVKGVIVEFGSNGETYGNVYIQDADGNRLYVYGIYSADGVTKYGDMAEKPGIGDTVTLYGALGQYNGTLQMKSGWMLDWTAGSGNQGGTTPDPTPDPETPAEGEWKVVTELKTGDIVVIGAPAYGKLLSAVKVATYYNKGVDYAENNFANVTDDELWVVTVNEDGTYSFTSVSGSKLGMADANNSLNADGPNYSWSLENQGNGIFYVKNNARDKYLEWYASKDNWSTYSPANSDLFEISFYVKGASEGGNQGGSTPETPETPDTPVDPQPPVHEHNFVEGKCECGETDPNYQPPAGDDDDGVMSIPEVLASAEGTAVIVKGTVCEIYQAWSDQYSNISFYIKDDAGNKLLVFRTGTKVSIGDQVTVTGKATVYNGTIQIAQGGTTVIDVAHVCSEFTTGSCTTDSYCVVCEKVATKAPGHNYVNGTCDKCGAAEPQGDVLPDNLVFTNLANKASADSYLKTNFPEWSITGKLGNGYAGYLGFGRSGDSKSSITSSEISVSSAFTVTTVIKGNGSEGVMTSTLTFTLIDKDGNTIATGYANGSTTAAITPVDAKDTTYNISFTFVDGKTWTDVSNLVVSFSKATGNIGLKSLNFVQ
jgi:hypothetical protein